MTTSKEQQIQAIVQAIRETPDIRIFGADIANKLSEEGKHERIVVIFGYIKTDGPNLFDKIHKELEQRLAPAGSVKVTKLSVQQGMAYVLSVTAQEDDATQLQNSFDQCMELLLAVIHEVQS